MSVRRSSSSIGTKILTRTLLVALIPLLVLSVVMFLGVNALGESADNQVEETRQLLSDESVEVSSEEQARGVAREINLVLMERVTDVVDWARNPFVVSGAEAAADFAEAEGLIGLPIDDLEARFTDTKSTNVAGPAQSFLRTEIDNKPQFREVFFTGPNGYNAASTAETSDFVQNDEDWWQDAWTDGYHIGDVEFDESAGVYSVDISIRIDGRGARRLGVMKAALDVAFVQDIAEANADPAEYIVALPDGLLIAETATDSASGRMMNATLRDDDVNSGLIGPLNSTTDGSRIGDDYVFGYANTADSEFFAERLSQLEGFDGFDWLVISTQPSDIAFAPLRGLQDINNDIENSGTNLRTTVLVVLLLGVLVAVLMARLLARGIVGPIQKLTGAASHAATRGLPEAVASIETAAPDETIEVPALELSTGDELEQLAGSFNSVQGTALRLAAEQALSRRQTSEMFVNLGRRNQSLIKRQLRFIDGLERTEADPDTLDALFKLDHLATRMRRNAESLLVLAGERSPRRWAAPVNMPDVVQAALAEVEDYERVDISRVTAADLQGNVVADVAHILAELVENALTFSPPDSTVEINGWTTDSGYTLTVVDSGLGMSEDELADANRRLAESRLLSEMPSESLGLFVVGRLADHLEVEVALTPSPSGGVTATIEVPAELVPTDTADDDDDTDAEAATADSTDGTDTANVTETAEDAAVEAENGDAEEAVVDEPVIAAVGNDEMPTEGTVSGRRSTDPEDPEAAEAAAAWSLPVRQADPSSPPAVNQGRRADDVAGEQPAADEPVAEEPTESVTASEDPGMDDDLARYGFTRRSSGTEPASADDPAPVAVSADSSGSTDPAPSTAGSTADKAETNRRQWSTFQRAKQDAESIDSNTKERDQ